MTTAWIEARVVRKRSAARDIAGLVLEAAGDTPLPPFEAGAHVDVELPNGLIRQYSLCGSPACADRYELGVLLEPAGRGGSRAVHEAVGEGDLLRISAPRNHFPLVPCGHAILLAGGIGVTPILSMAEWLHLQGKRFALHYCVRSQERAAFVERLEAAPFAGAVHLHYDDQPETALDIEALLGKPAGDTHLYICGPGGFIDFVTRSAKERGWPDSQVHIERFSAVPAIAGAEQPFEIEISGSGKIITVRADQSAAAAMAEAGIEIPLSCEQGICGTCLTEVREGIPDHRDMYLSPEEHAVNDCFTPCCSRALTARLVIQV